MSAATDSARIAPPGNVLTQDPVRSYQSGFISPRIRDLDVSGLEVGGRGLRHPALGARLNAWKEQTK
ncbi:hypothetical protein ACFC08_28115 [Streptomyces sp. NPDC056112]|uniref:hypothetical protein n=1 Tax=unclassified Streptomyces TaxID=2593676 RepID=UPI001CD2EA64|nr:MULTISPECIES: hypothetical protein [unclassified Streptomyces]